jgi:siroheme synthase-like protein
MRNPPVSSHPYPVNLDLSGRSVLVVGAGAVAARKVQGLIAAGARVTVVAPEAVSELAEASANGAIRWQQRTYRRGEVASYRLAVAATGDPDVNGQVHWDAEAAGVWLNAADDPDRCSFTLPAVVRRGDLQVAVSTNGRSPAVAAWLRRSLEESIGPEHATLLALAAEVREDLRDERGTTETPDWQFALDEDLLDLIRSDDVDGARLRLRRALGLPGVPDFEEAAS